MQENFIHLISTCEASVSINGKNVGIIDNINNFEIDFVSRTNKVYVGFQPINSISLPYTFELETNHATANTTIIIAAGTTIAPVFRTVKNMVFAAFRCSCADCLYSAAVWGFLFF